MNRKMERPIKTISAKELRKTNTTAKNSLKHLINRSTVLKWNSKYQLLVIRLNLILSTNRTLAKQIEISSVFFFRL